MGSVFLLATAISQPIFAELAHVIGRRPAYIASLTIFISGTILCGAARNSLMLLAGRAVQGVGSGGPQALSGMILADLFPIRERSRWVAYQNVSWALGTIAGPLVGGAFVENVDSNWVGLSNRRNRHANSNRDGSFGAPFLSSAAASLVVSSCSGTTATSVIGDLSRILTGSASFFLQYPQFLSSCR